MKKVKIMLTAITVFAVVGGALAFKARQIRTFYSINAAQTACDVAKTDFLTTNVGVQDTYTDAITTDLTKCTLSIVTGD